MCSAEEDHTTAAKIERLQLAGLQAIVQAGELQKPMSTSGHPVPEIQPTEAAKMTHDSIMCTSGQAAILQGPNEDATVHKRIDKPLQSMAHGGLNNSSGADRSSASAAYATIT